MSSHSAGNGLNEQPQREMSPFKRRSLAIAGTFFAGPGGGHLAYWRIRRGAIWFALFWASMLLMSVIGHWAMGAMVLTFCGALVDAALIKPVQHPLPQGGKIFVVWCGLLVFSVLGTNLIRATLIEAFNIPAGSMIPTLEIGDHIMVQKLGYEPALGDVVVFQFPKDEDKDFIKRIVAVGGDTVELKGRELHRNGTPVKSKTIPGPCSYGDSDYDVDPPEPISRQCMAVEEQLGQRRYRVIYDPMAPSMPGEGPVKVPAGHVFVLGDNRDNSHDSRFWGTVALDKIKGRADFIWWSSGPGGIRTERLGTSIQ